jgi:ParB/RepB/Spo0J family partition protein
MPKKQAKIASNEATYKPVCVGQVLEIPTKHILPDPYQPRETFNEQEMQELMASIKQSGLHQPITINKAYIKDRIQYYYIKYGERRWTAHCRLEIPTVKSYVIDGENYSGDHDIDRKINQAAENINRAGHTHREIVVLFREYAFERRRADKKVAVAVVQMDFARKFGKSLPWVQNYSALINLDDTLMKLVDSTDDDALPFTAAVVLARGPKESQLSTLQEAKELYPNDKQKAYDYIIKRTREIRSGKGEKIRGRDPGASVRLLETTLQHATRGFERLIGDRKKSDYQEWLTKLLMGKTTIEVDSLLRDFDALLRLFSQAHQVTQNVRTEKYRSLSASRNTAGTKKRAA